IRDAGQRLTSFVRTSVVQARGSTELSLHVSSSDAIMAHPAAPRSWPANSAFFLVKAKPRIERSTVFESISIRPSSRKRHKPSQWLRPWAIASASLLPFDILARLVLEPGLQSFDDGF